MKIPAESLTQTFSIATTDGANVEFPGGSLNGISPTINIKSYEESSNPLSALDSTSSGTIDIDVYTSSDDGTMASNTISNLATTLKIKLPIKGGLNIKCAFYNATSQAIETMTGVTDDSS